MSAYSTANQPHELFESIHWQIAFKLSRP